MAALAQQSGSEQPAVSGALPFRLACVTGTNGKTTTTTMLEAIASASGEPVARLTTLGAWVRGEQIGADTSVAVMQNVLELSVKAGVKTLCMETTSQALAKGVLAPLPPPAAAVFTNLTRDHLDYHGTPEHYLASKAQLFMALPPGGVAVLNAADPASALLDEVTPPTARRLAYTARPIAPECEALPIALRAERVEVDRTGTRITLAPSPLSEKLGGALTLRVVGDVHAENALAAAVAADALGYPPAAITTGLASFTGVPGRFQIVSADSRRRAASPGAPTVVVDYAHTPDALERTLRLARTLVEPGGRLFCIFGCGGDRDPGKRGPMGKVAIDRADVVVLTTDNPRSEAPEAIADQIVQGMEGRSGPVLRIPDRARAIRRAIGEARGADVVVIAGKGHEKTQVFRDRVVPFDDVEIARSALADGETGRKSRT